MKCVRRWTPGGPCFLQSVRAFIRGEATNYLCRAVPSTWAEHEDRDEGFWRPAETINPVIDDDPEERTLDPIDSRLDPEERLLDREPKPVDPRIPEVLAAVDALPVEQRELLKTLFGLDGRDECLTLEDAVRESLFAARSQTWLVRTRRKAIESLRRKLAPQANGGSLYMISVPASTALIEKIDSHRGPLKRAAFVRVACGLRAERDRTSLRRRCIAGSRVPYVVNFGLDLVALVDSARGRRSRRALVREALGLPKN